MADLSERVKTKTSPTFISTALLTPHQVDRVTIPAIGAHTVKVPPIGGHTWGENLTNYGGIGKLPFLGKTRARDLYVTRSLKHFGSGFSKYETNVQPMRITSLMKSACRVNDQLIPRPIKAQIKPWRELLDLREKGHELTPYYSHRSIFEVFPRHDPCRRTETDEPVFNVNTRDAICDLHKRIYSTPRYSSVFPYHEEFLKEQTAQIVEANLKKNLDCHKKLIYPNGDKDTKNPCCQCTIILEKMNIVLSPVTEVVTRAGEAAASFSAKDIFSLIFEYCGEATVTCMVNDLKECLHWLNSCDNCDTERERRDFGDFIRTKIFPMVQGLINTQGDVLDVITGKIPDPSVKPDYDDKTEKVVDALGQCQTLRSFIVGTNITSFDRAIIADLYSTDDESRKKKRIKGIAPLWPPSRYYVLNNQRMKLQSIGSFPSNFRYQSEIPTKEELEAMEEERKMDQMREEQREKLKKHVHFSDVVTTHNPPTYEYEPDEKYAEHVNHSGMGIDAYKTYLDRILHPVNEKACPKESEQTGDYDENGDIRQWKCEEMSDTEKQMLSSCRYSPAHPSAKSGDWRTRSIVDPNQHLKTLAQRRYHELHPAPIPDLRENHRFSKKYFFSGYHTSTFRG